MTTDEVKQKKRRTVLAEERISSHVCSGTKPEVDIEGRTSIPVAAVDRYGYPPWIFTSKITPLVLSPSYVVRNFRELFCSDYYLVLNRRIGV